MLYTTNKDIPGIIGTLGQTMGEYDVNIANFTLGRKNTGGDAIALLYLDCAPNQNAMDSLQKTGIFQTVSALKFEV
jgi:D-3-phosphoglycerate dehydrogenase